VTTGQMEPKYRRIVGGGDLDADVFDANGKIVACPLCGAEITITRRYYEFGDPVTEFRCERHGDGKETLASTSLRPPGFHLVIWRGAQLPWAMPNSARPWNVPPLRIKR
jgi:hypothetical protein